MSRLMSGAIGTRDYPPVTLQEFATVLHAL
jgi:hypothetical protein